MEKKVIVKKEKVNIIKEYDKNMGAVDLSDQTLYNYYSEHRNKKWTYKLSIYLLNLILNNSYICYKEFSKSSKKVLKHSDFLEKIIRNLLNCDQMPSTSKFTETTNDFLDLFLRSSEDVSEHLVKISKKRKFLNIVKWKKRKILKEFIINV